MKYLKKFFESESENSKLESQLDEILSMYAKKEEGVKIVEYFFDTCGLTIKDLEDKSKELFVKIGDNDNSAVSSEQLYMKIQIAMKNIKKTMTETEKQPALNKHVIKNERLEDILPLLAKSGKYDEFMNRVSENIDAESGLPLRVAIRHGNLNLVEKIVDAGADIGIRRAFPIRTACETFKIDILEYLLDRCEEMPIDFSDIVRWITDPTMGIDTTSVSSLKKSIAIRSVREIYEDKNWKIDSTQNQ
jgi:hypothetical protein